MVWWLLLLAWPESRAAFRMGQASDPTLWAFWLPDLLLVGAGSLVAGRLCYSRCTQAMAALWCVCGAVSYATLYCLAFALTTGSGWAGTTLMLPAMFLSLVCTLAVSGVGAAFFRQAKPLPNTCNIGKTMAQIVLIWGVVLFVLPHLLDILQTRDGIAHFQLPLQRPAATVLFLACSAVGLWSGLNMSTHGGGTPLPLDSPTILVIRGPYGHLRNPMAVAGRARGWQSPCGWAPSLYWPTFSLAEGSGSAWLARSRRLRCWSSSVALSRTTEETLTAGGPTAAHTRRPLNSCATIVWLITGLHLLKCAAYV